MNAPMALSLCKDALYQVLDNKVFRILMLLVLVPILGTLLFGFREDEIVFLFGLRRWSYGPIFEFFSDMTGARFGQNDPQTVVINGISSIVIEGLAGTFGVIFTIAATAFFVPRMIEKGAADVLFHKPLSRLSFYLSRYFAGLAFIALFSLLLVSGMYFGFLVVSRHNDPGILWAAVTLTYLFGLIYGVSMLIGVVTRSTVAAMLLTMIFFFFNGCIHQFWIQKEQESEKQTLAKLAAELVDEEDEAGEEAEEEDDSDLPPFVRLLLFTLDAIHYVGPKTTDAGYLTARLRAAVEGKDAFKDKQSGLAVVELRGGLAAAADAGAVEPPLAGAEDLLGEPVFHAVAPDGRSLSIWARERRQMEKQSAKRTRAFLEGSDDAADELEARLGASGAAGVVNATGSLGDDSPIVGVAPLFDEVRVTDVSWTAGDNHRRVLFFVYRDRFHALVLETPAELPEEERGAWTEDVLSQCGVLYEAGRPDWYGSRLGWTSELRFNLFFSLGSSLAFTAVVLLLGWWRLARIDF